MRSGCPVSTAESTAKAIASSANGTSSVARRTGRLAEERSDTAVPGPLRRRVSMLIGVELPPRRAVRRAVVPAPPERQKDEEPKRHHYRNHPDEARADHDDQRDEDGGREPTRGERLELVAPHPAQQTLVFLGRDVLRVPRTPAALAPPPLTVGNPLCLAALALDRDRRSAHRLRIVRRVRKPGSPRAIESVPAGCYGRRAAQPRPQLGPRQGGGAW